MVWLMIFTTRKLHMSNQFNIFVHSSHDTGIIPSPVGDSSWNRETCQAACPLTCGFRGFHVGGYGTSRCYCNYDNGGAVCPPEGFTVYTQDNPGTGPITSSSGAFFQCFKYVEEEVY